MSFNESVKLKYQLYNSLLLNLPFEGVSNTGMFLPILGEHCQKGLSAGKAPEQIIDDFFTEHLPHLDSKERTNQLFRYVQYLERQVVLFDAMEDAAFEKIHDTSGKGTITGISNKLNGKQDLEILQDKLQNFSVRVVLTAHPTQFYHGNILSIITQLDKAFREGKLLEINNLIKQLAFTKFYHKHKPTPLDEAISLIWYLENIFYQSIPLVFSDLKKTFKLDTIPSDAIRLGFWPGGDRDGNPFVTSSTTLEVAAKLKSAILRSYQAEIRQLKRRLTFEQTDILARKIELKITSALYRLPQESYTEAQELYYDLEEIKKLLQKHYNSLYIQEVEAFQQKVKTFGFYFASLDIRQDSRIHSAVVAEILGIMGKLSDYQKLKDDHEKSLFLLKNVAEISADNLQETLHIETIRSVKALQVIQQQNGEEACNRYIISNTQSALNVVELLFIIKCTAFTNTAVPIDIVPLFETIYDLKHAPQVMQFLYEFEPYAGHLKQRGMRQTAMLGFSDGTKDGGYLAANWGIYKAKSELSIQAKRYGVEIMFFDGRGGPPARGGGDTHDFYAAQGKSISSDQIQITIQGQTISSKFGNMQSSKYNLEQLLTAGLINELKNSNHRDFTPQEVQLFEELSRYSLDYYTDLKTHPRFFEYLEEVTVLNYYSETNIGSRPAKRKGGKLTLDALRAIPFVGAWSQMKQNVPGYYGFGRAMEKLKSQGREKELLELYQNSLFFRALVLNSMQSLAKTNFELTAYLKNNEKFGAFWHLLYEEYLLTKSWLLKLSGNTQLLQEYPNNRESIALREEMVLPLLVIQQYALLKLQKESDEALQEIWKKLVVRCFFGNINATRNAA